MVEVTRSIHIDINQPPNVYQVEHVLLIKSMDYDKKACVVIIAALAIKKTCKKKTLD
jgi:hypothetical protein